MLRLFALALSLAVAAPVGAQTLYGVTSPAPTVQTFGGGVLYTIDPATGAAQSVGPIGYGPVKGIAVHPRTGVIYAVGSRPTQFAPFLLTLDPATGAGTEVAPLSVCVPAGASCA